MQNKTQFKIYCNPYGCLIGAAAITSGFANGDASSPVWMMNVDCRGYETRLLNCPGLLGSQSCGHSRDAGVRCPATTNCTTGDIRLQGGSTPNQGIVEICFYNIWGRVCTDLWDTNDAQVACRQLGFTETGDLASLYIVKLVTWFTDICLFLRGR